MKHVSLTVFMFAAALMTSACGKTNFSSTDGASTLKAGDAVEDTAATDDGGGEPTGEILQEVIDDPAKADDHKCGNKKILICHVPPGNPENAHTLCISENAVAAHIAHVASSGEMDTLGDCTEEKKKSCQSHAKN